MIVLPRTILVVSFPSLEAINVDDLDHLKG